MNAIRFVAWLAVSLAVSIVGWGSAWATEVSCGPAEKGTITVDGLTDDWSDVPGVDAGGQDANASFTIKCNVIDGRTLALLVDVRDNYFVRTARAAAGEDHLELLLGGRPLVAFPGDAARIKDKLSWGGKPAKGVQSATALQPHGFAMELELPLSQVPGWKPGSPSIALAARFLDCDSKAGLKTERTVELSGRIVFAESDEALTAFLQDRGLQRSAVFWDKPMALGKKSGARAVMAGRFLAVLSDGFLFMELPFRDKKDLRDVRLIDLAGDGRDAIVMRYLERGGGGAREVLAVFRPVGESQLQRVFACEVAKSSAAGRIDDKASFVKRGRATDVVVEAGAASNLSAANWREAPAEDMVPILLPWGDDRRARYQFAGDEYKRAQ
jgi:hypothetical protein